MDILAYNYETEIMWCDIGATPSDMVHMAPAWINWAAKQGRQVAFNNRCGLGGDFTTPEYVTITYDCNHL